MSSAWASGSAGDPYRGALQIAHADHAVDALAAEVAGGELVIDVVALAAVQAEQGAGQVYVAEVQRLDARPGAAAGEGADIAAAAQAQRGRRDHDKGPGSHAARATFTLPLMVLMTSSTRLSPG